MAPRKKKKDTPTKTRKPRYEHLVEYKDLEEDDQDRVRRAIFGLVNDFQLDGKIPISILDYRCVQIGSVIASLDPQSDGWVVWLRWKFGLTQRTMLHAREYKTPREALKDLIEYLPPDKRKL